MTDRDTAVQLATTEVRQSRSWDRPLLPRRLPGHLRTAGHPSPVAGPLRNGRRRARSRGAGRLRPAAAGGFRASEVHVLRVLRWRAAASWSPSWDDITASTAEEGVGRLVSRGYPVPGSVATTGGVSQTMMTGPNRPARWVAHMTQPRHGARAGRSRPGRHSGAFRAVGPRVAGPGEPPVHLPWSSDTPTAMAAAVVTAGWSAADSMVRAELPASTGY